MSSENFRAGCGFPADSIACRQSKTILMGRSERIKRRTDASGALKTKILHVFVAPGSRRARRNRGDAGSSRTGFSLSGLDLRMTPDKTRQAEACPTSTSQTDSEVLAYTDLNVGARN